MLSLPLAAKAKRKKNRVPRGRRGNRARGGRALPLLTGISGIGTSGAGGQLASDFRGVFLLKPVTSKERSLRYNSLWKISMPHGQDGGGPAPGNGVVSQFPGAARPRKRGVLLRRGGGLSRRALGAPYGRAGAATGLGLGRFECPAEPRCPTSFEACPGCSTPRCPSSMRRPSCGGTPARPLSSPRLRPRGSTPLQRPPGLWP